MADERILSQIEVLVEEEKRLRENETPENAPRLAYLEEALDQCWDLLRRRRALREFGQDPDDATLRGPDTVENYLQ
jgi:hypothetical protein